MASYMLSKIAGNTTEPPCSNATEVYDCSQDPNISMVADSCLTGSITLNYSMISDFSFNMLGCGVKSNCSTLKNSTRGMMGPAFQSNLFVDLTRCDVSCCEGDRCNGPSAVGSTSSNPGPSATSGPTAAALQCTKTPSNVTIFSIVCLVYLVISNCSKS